VVRAALRGLERDEQAESIAVAANQGRTGPARTE
jgi:hypothetical protein